MRTIIAATALNGAVTLFATGLELASSDSDLTPVAFGSSAILLVIGLVAVVPPILKSVSLRKSKPVVWTPTVIPRRPSAQPVSNLGLLAIFGPILPIVFLLVAEERYPRLSVVREGIVVVCVVALVVLLVFYFIREWLIPYWRRFKGDPYH